MPHHVLIVGYEREISNETGVQNRGLFFPFIHAIFIDKRIKICYAQIISLARGFFVLIPIAFLLSVLFQMTGVWCAYPMSECIVAIMGLVLYIINERHKNRDCSRL